MDVKTANALGALWREAENILAKHGWNETGNFSLSRFDFENLRAAANAARELMVGN